MSRKWKVAGLTFAVLNVLLIIIATIIVSIRSKHSSADVSITTTTARIVSTHSTESSSFPWPSNTSGGCPLSHSLYYNAVSLSQIEGYVVNVTLRLFTNWEGDKPLYIFALKQVSLSSTEIIHRYPVIPQTNNTQWQMIDIPFGVFPIPSGHFIGVGMQDRSDTNQIYAVKFTVGFHEVNITKNARDIRIKSNLFQGVAFDYTAVENPPTMT